MSGTKWHENDFTLPSRLIAPLPGRLGSKTDKEAGIYPFTEPTLAAPFPCMAVYGAPLPDPPPRGHWPVPSRYIPQDDED